MNFTRASLLKVHGVAGRDVRHFASNIQEILHQMPENNYATILILPLLAETGEHTRPIPVFHALVVERETLPEDE